jgi:hypothetical protein
MTTFKIIAISLLLTSISSFGGNHNNNQPNVKKKEIFNLLPVILKGKYKNKIRI